MGARLSANDEAAIKTLSASGFGSRNPALLALLLRGGQGDGNTAVEPVLPNGAAL